MRQSQLIVSKGIAACPRAPMKNLSPKAVGLARSGALDRGDRLLSSPRTIQVGNTFWLLPSTARPRTFRSSSLLRSRAARPLASAATCPGLLSSFSQAQLLFIAGSIGDSTPSSPVCTVKEICANNSVHSCLLPSSHLLRTCGADSVLALYKGDGTMPDGKRKRRHSTNLCKRQWYADHRSRRFHRRFGLSGTLNAKSR
jgi:hypothetical protein